jgi:hypothetical protein
MAKNKNLNNARNLKNDEFYTQLHYIEKEAYNYGIVMGHFKDKTILLPCDESEHTNFYKHFMMNREEYGWKKLISVGYRENRPAEVHIVEVTEDGMREENKLLIGNGDFRNAETQKFFDECDVVVTNPPFSLLREFVAMLVKKNKKFLIVSILNAVKYKEIFPLIRANKLWLGMTCNSEDMVFGVPEGTEINPKDKLKAEKLGYVGNYTRLGNACWFTNMRIKKREVKLNTGIDFEYGTKIGWYQKYDNYDAINVNRTEQIPMDYDGIMGVPISFLDKYNPDQFEIIDLLLIPSINGVKKFTRILIKAKR